MSKCAACQYHSRQCPEDCIFAKFFPAYQIQKFAVLHTFFGTGNVHRVLGDLPFKKRQSAVNSIIDETEAWLRVIEAQSTLRHYNGDSRNPDHDPQSLQSQPPQQGSGNEKGRRG